MAIAKKEQHKCDNCGEVVILGEEEAKELFHCPQCRQYFCEDCVLGDSFSFWGCPDCSQIQEVAICKPDLYQEK